MGQLVMVGGGMRSGKSGFALGLAESLGKRRVFIATAEPRDAEMVARIARHRREREDRFALIESPTAVAQVVRDHGGADVILLECLTLLLSNLMERGRDDREVLDEVDALVAASRAVSAAVIVVTNEVGLGLISEYPEGRRFQELVGWSHQRIATAAHSIYLAVLGCVLRIRPEPLTIASSQGLLL
jgi:adenosylcobinamide kinase / adenosylcobinamide-phosphate guanylyltransferase